ncbi:MAG: hypothetical protein J1E16_11395 [Muribaculaceae bacterium]|nr:hypothetical protein [Muribaculaceae bacterium]
MNPINSSSFFHFTSSIDILKCIIEKGLRYSFCFEPYPSKKKRSKGCAIPMICFCDIPLTRTLEHTKVYGKYSIGLDKEISVGELKELINPVLYLSSPYLNNNIIELQAEDKYLSNYLCSINGINKKKLNQLCDNIYDYDKVSEAIEIVEPSSSEHYLRYIENQKTLYFLLGYSKTTFSGSKPNNFDNYNEREWRIIPLYSPKNANWEVDITEAKYSKIRNLLNDKAPFLIIYPSHYFAINYIMVNKEDEIEEITDFILSSKTIFGGNLGFTKRDMKKRYSLLSKLISFERIEKDF